MRVYAKRICLIVITFLMVLFLFSFHKTIHASSQIEVKDFRNIVIEPYDENSYVYKIKDMVGVDKERSSGEIRYYGSENMLMLSNVKIFQTEDSLLYDKDGKHLPLIQLNLGLNCGFLRITVEGENEIVNYGTTIEVNSSDIDKYSGTLQLEILGFDDSDTESVLKINNRRCYDGTESAAIALNLPTKVYMEKSWSICSLILSGVGGIESSCPDASEFHIEESNLFINVNSEDVDYFVDGSDPLDNEISFSSEANTFNSAISGFKRLACTGPLPYDQAYDEVNHYNILTKDGVSMKSNEFYYGDFVSIKTVSDLVYYLGLKDEDQGSNYINLVLDNDLSIKFDKDYIDLMSGSETKSFATINGRKRLFLNGNDIRGLYETKKSSSNLFWVTNDSIFDLFGSHLSYPSGSGNRIIYAYSKYKEDKSYSIMDIYGNTSLYGGAKIISISDGDEDLLETGNIKGYTIDGNAITVHGEGLLSLYDADIWGGSGYSDSMLNHKGVICLCYYYNPILYMYGGAIHSGNNENENGFLVYEKKLSSIVRNAWRFYGGLLQSHGFLQKRLVRISVESSSFIANEKAILRYENTTDSLFGSDHSVINGEHVLIESGLYEAGKFNAMLNENKVYDNELWGNYLRYADPYYAPYIKDDLPEHIYVNGESKLQEFKLTLFNSDNPYYNTDDYTMGKHYSTKLFIKNGDEVTLFIPQLANDKIGMEPYKSLDLIFKDKKYSEYGNDYYWTDHNEPILVVKPTFPKQYDGLKVQLVITNNYSGAVTYSKVATIHVTEEIVEPVISLTGPKEAFSKPGFELEMGLPNPESKITARVTNQYSNTIYVQWYDIGSDENDSVPATGMLEYKMVNVDENDMFYQDVEFTPSAGSDKVGLHGYKLLVWTYSKYGDNTCKITRSKTVWFNVTTSTPKIVNNLPNQLNLEENDLINLSLTVDDSVPNVGYEWYYYPSYEHYTGIDQNNSKVTLGTLYPTLFSDKAMLQSNGNKNILTYDLFDKLELGKKYRVIFDEYSDTLDGLVNVTLEYGDDAHNVTPIASSYNEIMGKYPFNSEFSYLIVDRADMYLDPTYAKLIIEFKDNVSSKAMHVFEDFYLQEYDEENDLWQTVANLNPYHYGLNYQGVYPLLEGGNQIKVDNISTLSATLNMDGYYLYCKVYNTLDPTRYVYSNATRLNVGLTAYQPEFDYPDFTNEFVDFGETKDITIGVAQPIVKGNWVVQYETKFLVQTVEKDIHGDSYIREEYKSLSDMVDYGFTISVTTIASGENAGKVNIDLTLRSDASDIANQLYNHHFMILVTAYSPKDTSLTDEVVIDVLYDYPDDDFEISSINFYHKHPFDSGYDKYPYDMTSNSESKFYSGDGSYQIHDVLYLTSQSAIELNAHRVNHYSNFDLDNDQKVFYEWRVKWLEKISEDTYIPCDMKLEDLYKSTLRKYAYIEFNNNHLYFRFLTFDPGDEFDGLKYHNLVIYCSMYNYMNGADMYTDYYQLSYVDLQSLDDLDINYTEPMLDVMTGDVTFTVSVNTGIYNNSFWIDYDLDYKRLLAKDNDKYEVKAESFADGYIFLKGLGFKENNFKNYGDGTYGCDWTEDAEYVHTFNKDNSPYSFTYEVRVSASTLRKLAIQGDSIYTDLDVWEWFLKKYRRTTEELTDKLGENFEYELTKSWYRGVYIEGWLNINLNNGIPLYLQWISNGISDRALLRIIYPEGYEDEFKASESLNLKKDEEKYIGDNNPLGQYYARYSWVLYNTYTEEYQTLVENSDDCYLKVDTSKYYVDRVYILETTISSTEDFIEGTYCSYYTYYVVTMVPTITAPTFTGFVDKAFQLNEPQALISGEIINNDPEHIDIAYYFVVDGMLYDKPDYTCSIVVRPTELGDYSYKVVAIATYNYLDEYGRECSYSQDFTSEEYTITVIERLVNSIDIIGCELPIAMEHPSVDGIERGDVLAGDKFFGYKITSKFWSIDSESLYEFDKSYTLTVIIDILDGAEFDEMITALFNSIYPATITKLSDSQLKLTYEFTSTESVSIDQIEVTLPSYEVLSVIRPLDNIETDYYALHDFSFNTNDKNFDYGKVYTLNVKLRVYSQYHLEENAKVIVNGNECSYKYANGIVEINYDYYFPFKAKVVVGEKETVVESGKDNKITLSISNEDIPAGDMFLGWFIGDEPISSEANTTYLVDKNGLVITARFGKVQEISKVNIGEHDFAAGQDVPELPSLVWGGFSVSYEFDTTDEKFAYLKRYTLTATITAKEGYAFSENIKIYSGEQELTFTVVDGKIVAKVEYIFLYYAFYEVNAGTQTKVYSDENGKLELTASETYLDMPFDGWYLVGQNEVTLVTKELKLEVTLSDNGNVYRAIYHPNGPVVVNKIELPELPALEVGKSAPSAHTQVYQLTYDIKVLLGDSVVSGNLEYLKEYKLVLTISPDSGYEFDKDAEITVGGKKITATFNEELGTFTYEVTTVFYYEAQIKVLDSSKVVKSDINGDIVLDLDSVPSGKSFVGWYKGDELISKDKHYTYRLSENGVVIEAKFETKTTPDKPKEVDGNYVISGDNKDIKDAVDQAKEDDKGLTVEKDDISVTLDKDTVKELADKDVVTLLILTGEEYATGNIKKANLSNVKLVLELSLDSIPNNLNAVVKVPVNFEVKEGEVVKVFYVSPEGIIENMDATYENGIISFRTSHFSTYVVTLDQAEAQPSTKKGNGWIIILIIVLLLLAGGGIFLFIFLKKKKESSNEEEPKEEVTDNEQNEEVTDDEPQEEKESEEEVKEETTPNEEKGVIFKEKKTLNEEYASLSKEDRKLYDMFKAKTLSKDDIRTTEAVDSYTVYRGKDKLVRMKIKSGKIMVEFFANDSGLKEIIGGGSKEAATNIKIANEDDLSKALEALDYKYESLNKKDE